MTRDQPVVPAPMHAAFDVMTKSARPLCFSYLT